MASDVDVIISWPDNMDYPLWREFILAHTHYFNKIFIVFTETNTGISYKDFVREALQHPQIEFMDSKTTDGEDWRSVAVNMALDKSRANWVWFTEQDLFITSQTFWSTIRVCLTRYDVIGYKDGATRMHPSNLWVKREYINKTGKDFGIVPNKLDHFARFYTQLRVSGATIKALPYDPANSHFYHMNGLSSNLSLVQRGELPNYRPDEFNQYIAMTLQVEKLDPRYKKMCEEYNARI